jgi:hypothetical protein
VAVSAATSDEVSRHLHFRARSLLRHGREKKAVASIVLTPKRWISTTIQPAPNTTQSWWKGLMAIKGIGSMMSS